MFIAYHAVLSVHCGHLLGKGYPIGSLVCDVLCVFVTLPCGVLGQVWYLIVLIPNICLIPYFAFASFYSFCKFCFVFLFAEVVFLSSLEKMITLRSL